MRRFQLSRASTAIQAFALYVSCVAPRLLDSGVKRRGQFAKRFLMLDLTLYSFKIYYFQ